MKLTRKEYTTPEEKKRDFWRGFWLWWGANVLMAVVFGAIIIALQQAYSSGNGTLNTVGQVVITILGILRFLINIGLLIYLAMTRSQMALGALVAFGAALVIVFIVLPLIAAVACFIMLGNTG